MEINIVAVTHEDYRAWVYNKIDGEMVSKIVDAETASKLYSEGWRTSPAEFTEVEELKGNLEFEAQADEMSKVLNFLLNIDKCEDTMALREFGQNFLQLKLHHKLGVKSLRRKINEKATKLNLFEEDSK